MYSMTGYGRAEYTEPGINLTVEVRSVNNRNLDLTCKLPRALAAYEDVVRRCVQEKVRRGRVDVFVTFVDNREKPVTLVTDHALAASYLAAAKGLSAKFDLQNDITLSGLMRVQGVIREETAADDYAEFVSALEDTLRRALDALNLMRRSEGEKLVADLKSRMAMIESVVGTIAERAPEVKNVYAEKLKARMAEMLGGVAYDEARLLNEVAFFADKSDITEEVTRLKSHAAQFYVLTEREGAGKQLDFLVQEFNREANTICSKANDIGITEQALILKGEIEKIREQIQNLE